MTKEEFVKLVNRLRKAHKNEWFYYQGEVGGKDVQLKAYQTWVQIYKVDGIDYSGPMDVSVKKFNEVLERPFQ